MILADSWYSSGTFWGAVGAIAALGTCVVATYVAILPRDPIRHLKCTMLATPLLKSDVRDIPGDVRIFWEGTDLEDALKLVVTLTNQGRSPIRKEDFDRPLRLTVGATIKGVWATSSGPNSSIFSPVSFEGDTLIIGPGLIQRRQPVKFTILAGGRKPELRSKDAALPGVNVEVVSADSPQRRWTPRIKMAGVVAVTAAAAGLVLTGLLIGRHPAPSGKPPEPSPAASAPSPGHETPGPFGDHLT
jgi:hypothetical protein